MRNRASHIFNRRAKRQHDSPAAQYFKVSGNGALATVKQSIGQIFDGQQTSLLESFNAHPLHSMLSQGLNALALAHLEVFDAGIKGKDNGDLLTLR